MTNINYPNLIPILLAPLLSLLPTISAFHDGLRGLVLWRILIGTYIGFTLIGLAIGIAVCNNGNRIGPSLSTCEYPSIVLSILIVGLLIVLWGGLPLQEALT